MTRAWTILAVTAGLAAAVRLGIDGVRAPSPTTAEDEVERAAFATWLGRAQPEPGLRQGDIAALRAALASDGHDRAVALWALTRVEGAVGPLAEAVRSIALDPTASLVERGRAALALARIDPGEQTRAAFDAMTGPGDGLLRLFVEAAADQDGLLRGHR